MSLFNWKRTSPLILKNTEEEIFACLKIKPEGYFIKYSRNYEIWTISFNRHIDKTPLVFVHGMGSGVGLWVLNFLSLMDLQCPIYAFDVLGFGQSSRIKFPKGCDAVENEFVSSIEEWREKNKINKMILLGHSLGGYLTSAYTIKYPQYVEHLILADPWGFPEKPANQPSQLPWWARSIKFLLTPFNPFAPLRAAGPWGPELIAKCRKDLIMKYEKIYPKGDIRIAKYIYHCNAQNPSGEVAFTSLMEGFGYACNPMVNRIESIAPHIPITFLYGEYSWIDRSTGEKVKEKRQGLNVYVHIIENAGHHVYADNPEQFNDIVIRICTEVNNLKCDKSNMDINLVDENTLDILGKDLPKSKSKHKKIFEGNETGNFSQNDGVNMDNANTEPI